MNYIQTITWTLTISAASLLMGCMGVSGSSEATSESSVGEATSAYTGYANPPFPHNYVNVRSGPGTMYSLIRSVPRGQPIALACWTTGYEFHGTNEWFQTVDGGFVSAAGVDMPPGLPQCDSGGFGAPRR